MNAKKHRANQNNTKMSPVEYPVRNTSPTNKQEQKNTRQQAPDKDNDRRGQIDAPAQCTRGTHKEHGKIELKDVTEVSIHIRKNAFTALQRKQRSRKSLPFGLPSRHYFLSFMPLFKRTFMKIAKHTVASLTYSLRVDGEFVEETTKENPLVFLAGVGAMIPGFEKQLMGKQKGDNYNFEVSPEEGYGEIDKEAIIDVSKEIFKVDGVLQEELLQVGREIPLQDQNGRPLRGIVLDVAQNTVKLDFNHRLAGKTLNFSGEIVDVREASEDEISHGHVHGPGGHHH